MKSNALCLLLASLTAEYSFRLDARAGEAVFSADGKSVLCLQPQTATVLRITIPQKPGEEPEAFDLSKAVGEMAVLRAICRTKDGTFMLAAPGALFAWKPGGDPQQAAAAPESHKISDVAVHPLTGGIMAPGFREAEDEQSSALMVRDPGEKDLTSQESLPQNMSTAIFDGEGRFFFGVDACLCAGGLQKHDDGGESFTFWPVAPLDAPRLDNGTSSDSLSITGIAPAGQWLYISMASDVDCALLRLPRPDMKLKAGHLATQASGTRKARWKRFSTTLGALENLESESQPYFSSIRALCGAPDGKTVFLAGTPILHPEREEYWTINVKTGERTPHGDRPVE